MIQELFLYRNGCIFIREEGFFIKVKLYDIEFLRAQRHDTRIFSSEADHLIHYPLNETLAQLKSADFIRVHRFYVINLQQVDTFNDAAVYIKGKEIPLGRSYKEEFFRRFNFF